MANGFMKLGQDEVISILADAGVTRGEFGEAMRRPFASEDLLAPAMYALGIDLNALEQDDPSRFRDVRRICMLCDHRFRCHRELGDLSFADTYTDFCPNSETVGKGRSHGMFAPVSGP